MVVVPQVEHVLCLWVEGPRHDQLSEKAALVMRLRKFEALLVQELEYLSQLLVFAFGEPVLPAKVADEWFLPLVLDDDQFVEIVDATGNSGPMFRLPFVEEFKVFEIRSHNCGGECSHHVPSHFEATTFHGIEEHLDSLVLLIKDGIEEHGLSPKDILRLWIEAIVEQEFEASEHRLFKGFSGFRVVLSWDAHLYDGDSLVCHQLILVLLIFPLRRQLHDV
jgi:hypothetical protein